MPKHHTAFNKKTKRKAEELGGGPLGLAPFRTFLQDFNPIFHARTRPSFYKRAEQYLSGLFQLDHRRNVEKIHETTTGADYQSLHHFLTHSKWDDKALSDQIAGAANELLGGSPDSCLLIDPSGFPKKGKHSVGVGRQYCGNTGKVDNCQVGVFSALGRGRDACLINKRLYLPKAWSEDQGRCDEAGIPDADRDYRNRSQLALELIDDADRQQLQYAWIGMDAEFGHGKLLPQLHQRGKTFLVDVRSTTPLYKNYPRLAYRPKKNGGGRMRLKPKSVKADIYRLARGKRKWRWVEIRDSTKGIMAAEFLLESVWFWNGEEDSEPMKCHLIIRRIKNDSGKGWQYKYSLSNAPAKTPLQRLAYQQSQRFWVEQAIRDAKDSLGLDEYQARK